MVKYSIFRSHEQIRMDEGSNGNQKHPDEVGNLPKTNAAFRRSPWFQISDKKRPRQEEFASLFFTRRQFVPGWKGETIFNQTVS